MPITEFKIRKEVLVNTGNYENTKICHEITYQIDIDNDGSLEDENRIDDAQDYVTERLDTYLNNQVRLHKSMKGR